MCVCVCVCVCVKCFAMSGLTKGKRVRVHSAPLNPRDRSGIEIQEHIRGTWRGQAERNMREEGFELLMEKRQWNYTWENKLFK